ncbi:Ca2+:H+ antiporter [Bowdeniella nasicola]|uniref:Ca2+:H+ antiporter n=1 Tax=Bowdeniella nasicola TaxID=208480 RepID=A0A1H4ADR0_9ACTO|nr:hypothetical protein [Bowdeniella nasicola]SEA33654.1 Ca2+:H+ antiporter [Bowdeniella nasicola]
MTTLARLATGWLTALAVMIARPWLTAQLPSLALAAVLAAVITAIVISAFGVVTQAERLARLMGEPYGTLILTLSIVLIEVVLIAAVMLSPAHNPTIARDSVMGAAMIVLTLVMGLALLVGGRRDKRARVNPAGFSLYLTKLILLLTLAFVLPATMGEEGAYLPQHEVPIILATVALYGCFLYRQTGTLRADFQEPGSPAAQQGAPIGDVLRDKRREVLTRAALLVISVIPIVLLSHDMAGLLDAGLDRLGAPVALTGLLIAIIVFLPEGITAVRASRHGELQRTSNLAHGALVSCVGLTLPVVLIIGMISNQHVVLAESPTTLVLLATGVLLNAATSRSNHPSQVHGAALLCVFGIYAMTVIS